MASTDLSSNWKQLQAKLKASKPAAAAAAAARTTSTPTATLPPSTNSTKRKRTTHSESDSKSSHPSSHLPAGRKRARHDENYTNDNDYNTHRSAKSKRHSTKLNGNYSTAVKKTAPPRNSSGSRTPKPTTMTTTSSSSCMIQADEASSSLSTTITTLTNAGLNTSVEIGKYLALDCEMVGVGPNPQYSSALARVSIVTFHGDQLYDSYVLPLEPVTDWRTHVSGITPANMRYARTLAEVQRTVGGLLKGRILIGHSVRNDLDALMLGHPRRDIRDTARYPPYRKQVGGGGSPRLRDLASQLLGLEIQTGEHSSVEDAKVTMMLFRREKDGFERENARRWGVAPASRMEQQREAVKLGEDDGDAGEVDAGGDVASTARKSRNKKKKKKKKK